MNKAFYKSKTIWGFGIAGIIALSQVFGISVSESLIAEIVKILSAFFGVYGIRDAI